MVLGGSAILGGLVDQVRGVEEAGEQLERLLSGLLDASAVELPTLGERLLLGQQAGIEPCRGEGLPQAILKSAGELLEHTDLCRQTLEA
ncbi:MAG: hypothetical protein C4345_06735, partial [Chloroflexota bacterium]